MARKTTPQQEQLLSELRERGHVLVRPGVCSMRTAEALVHRGLARWSRHGRDVLEPVEAT